MRKLNRERLEQLKTEDPKAYAEATEMLKALDELRERNPIQFFKPHPKQAQLLGAQTKVKAFLGGNRAGKTTVGVVDDLIQAVDEECLPDHLKPYKKWQPPFYCRVLVPDFKDTLPAILDELQAWVPKDQLLGANWDTAFDKQHYVLRFQNGSRFSFNTAEQDVSKLGSVKLHRAHYDEEPPESHRKECAARLMDFDGDEVFTMTPLLGMSWMYDQVWERRGEDAITVVQASTDENPHLSKKAVESYFSDMTPEEQDARRRGRFVHFGGTVLQGFTDRHLLDPIAPDHLKGQQIIVGIDPGIVRGAVVWCAFDKDDLMLVFDELYPQNTDVPTLCQQIKDRNKRWGIEPDYVIDPSGRNRTMTGTVLDEFIREGINCAPGMNDREAGILQLRRRIWAEPSALKVTRDCPNWLWERTRWRVEEDEESGQNKAKSKSGDTFKTAGPDHLMDCTRYVSMMRPWGPDVPERKQRRNHFTPDWEPPYKPTSPEESSVMGTYA